MRLPIKKCDMALYAVVELAAAMLRGICYKVMNNNTVVQILRHEQG